MKKLLFSIFSLLLVFGLLSCEKDIKLDEEVSVVAPGGIPYLALSNLVKMDNVDVKAVEGTEVQAALIKGEPLLIVAPLNMGVKLISAGKADYKLVTPITFNNAFLVTSKANQNKITDVNSLSGLTIHAFGEAGIPGSVLKSLFTSNDLDMSNVDFEASSNAILAKYKEASLNEEYILISEPELSQLDKSKYDSYSLNSLFGRDIPQAAIFVKADGKKETIDKLLTLIERNIKLMNKDKEKFAKEATSLNDKIYNAWGKDLIVKFLPNSGISYNLNKEDVSAVLKLLGVASVSEEIYYQR